MLGYEHAQDDQVTTTAFITSNSNCSITQVGKAFRYYEEIHFGKFYIRLHYGYKVPKIVTQTKASVVAVGFSLRKHKQ